MLHLKFCKFDGEVGLHSDASLSYSVESASAVLTTQRLGAEHLGSTYLAALPARHFVGREPLAHSSMHAATARTSRLTFSTIAVIVASVAAAASLCALSRITSCSALSHNTYCVSTKPSSFVSEQASLTGWRLEVVSAVYSVSSSL